jgi:dTMP kinase
MKNKQGTFIVIEGTDGSGKGTQFKRLLERLEQEGYDVATFDFPQYDKPSSYFVKEYLNGKYGTADEVGPYTASLFFSLDRYEAAPAIRKAIDEGKVVIANRYTGSNMAHQGTKFGNAEQRRGYFIWLDSLEFQMLSIPRPSQSIVLRVPAETAQQLVDQKGERTYTDKKRDIHEADLNHLKRSVEVYDDLCQLFPKDFTRIDCVRGGELLDIEAVSRLLWEKIEPLLPEPPKKSTAQAAAQRKNTTTALYPLYTPTKLDPKTAERYQKALSSICAKRQEIIDGLAPHNRISATVAQALLPVAAFAADNENTDARHMLDRQNPALTALAKEADASYSSVDDKAYKLLDYWPRNELSTVPNIMYAYSSLPFNQIADNVSAWSYDRKAEVLTAALQGDTAIQLPNVHYTIEAITDFATVQALRATGAVIEHQPLTPRFGYDIPEALTDAKLSELFESCFDASLELYSQLQAAGYAAEAPFATLLGHKLRCKITLDLGALRQIVALAGTSTAAQNVSAGILEAIAEVHPLLANVYRAPQQNASQAANLQ